MKLSTTIKHDRTVEFDTPIYKKEVKDGWFRYLAVLNFDTCIKIIESPFIGFHNFMQSTPNSMTHDIVPALDWEDITESEFLEAHKNFLASCSLEPVLSEIDKEIESELSSKNQDDLKDIL